MSILKKILKETIQISEKVNINLTYLEKLPVFANYDGFSTTYEDSNCIKRYWVDWTEEFGAWINTDGSEVEIIVRDSCRNSDIPGYLTLGLSSLITGACLSLQNQVALHANSVSLNGIAIAFAGFSGQGKSTLSAYIASRGTGFVTDDVLVLNSEGLVVPGNPRIKLYPHTGASLGFEGGKQTEYKTFYEPEQLGAKLNDKPVPLGIIYLLADNTETIYSEQLSPSKAVFELLPHSYYAHQLITKNSQLFAAYMGLVGQFSIRKLYYPRNFNILPQVYDFLQEEVRDLSKSNL